jgi:hypothetical protein
MLFSVVHKFDFTHDVRALSFLGMVAQAVEDGPK